MLKKPREGKGIPTFAKKKLGPPPTTPPQPKRPCTNRQPESGGFSRIINCSNLPISASGSTLSFIYTAFYFIGSQFLCISSNT